MRILDITTLVTRLRYSLAPAPSSAVRAVAVLPEGPESPIAKLKHHMYVLITVRMHHRRARLTRSVKNLSLNAISLISGVQVTDPFVPEERAGQFYRHACVWQKRPTLCRTKALALDYPSMSTIDEKSSGASGA